MTVGNRRLSAAIVVAILGSAAAASVGVSRSPADAAAGDAVVPGAIQVAATFENIGVYWPIGGDADRNASMTIRYRASGEVTWRDGAPAMKAEPTTIVDGAPLGLHHLAASALLLQPGTAYDVQATITDPDGGGLTSPVTTVATRVEPQANPAGRVRLVVPGGGGGDGSASNPFQGLPAAAAAAVAGDIFQIAAGRYTPFSVTASGTPSSPIVFRGAAGGGTIVDGANTDRGVVTIGSIATGGAHVILEGLVIENGHWGIDADSTHDITVRANVIRDVDFGIVNRRENGVEHNQTIVDNQITGRTVWPQGDVIPEEQGTELRGDGNVVAYNRIDHFADCISIQPRSGPSNGNDVVGNDASYCVDDGIQVDYNIANVRVWRNRVTNARMGVSVQPIRGGPAYIFRNEFVNLQSNPVKMNNNPSGFVVVNNTSIKHDAGLYDPAETWRNALFRNNLMLGTGYAFEFTTVADEGFRDFDFDAWGTTRAGTSGDPWFKWDNTRYADLAALQTIGVEAHGVSASFAHLANASLSAGWDSPIAPGSRDLQLVAGAPEVDAGTVVPGMSDGFVGTRPDMGAYEQGQTTPSYGPRAGIAVLPPAGAPARFVAFGPVRQLDTRSGDQGGRHPGGRATRVYTLPDVPPQATAVTLNVTAVNPRAGGFLSVFPCAGGAPATSSLNYQTDRDAVPNQVTVAVAGSQVCMLSQEATDLVVDLAGWWLPSGAAELVPAQRRVWDTRVQSGGATGSVLTLDLASLSTALGDVSGVAVNLTATDAAGPGFLTAYDCEGGRPLASNVNYSPGITTANLATVALRSTARRLCVFVSNRTNVVVDLTGWWVAGSGARALVTMAVPDRRLDTRVAGGLTGRLAPGRVVQVHAPSPRTLFANVTADAAAGPGFIAVFPCAGGWPGTSTVNYRASVPVADAALVDATSGVCAVSNQAVDLILDVFGEST